SIAPRISSTISSPLERNHAVVLSPSANDVIEPIAEPPHPPLPTRWTGYPRAGDADARVAILSPPRDRNPCRRRSIRLRLAHTPADTGLDEAVDVAVEDRAGVVDLVVGAQILDHLVRVQHVGAQLVAPGGALVGLERVHLGALLLALALQQLGLQHAHGRDLVL